MTEPNNKLRYSPAALNSRGSSLHRTTPKHKKLFAQRNSISELAVDEHIQIRINNTPVMNKPKAKGTLYKYSMRFNLNIQAKKLFSRQNQDYIQIRCYSNSNIPDSAGSSTANLESKSVTPSQTNPRPAHNSILPEIAGKRVHVFHKQENSEGENEKSQTPILKKRMTRKIRTKIIKANDKELDSSGEFTDYEMNEDKLPVTKISLLRSVYEKRPSTVFFDYPKCCFLPEKPRNRVFYMSTVEYKDHYLTYQIGDSFQYSCIMKTLASAGFIETDDEDYNINIGKAIDTDFLRDFAQGQKSNHFPGSNHLGRKDMMWKHYSRMQKKFENDYNFCPETYILPDDYRKLNSDRDENPKSI